MSHQSQTPDYVPPPRSSSGGVIVVIAVVLLLLVVCGVGLLGVGFMTFRAVEVQQPAIAPQPIPQAIPSAPVGGEQPVEAAPEQAAPEQAAPNS